MHWYSYFLYQIKDITHLIIKKLINSLKKIIDSVQKLLIAKLILTSQNIMMMILEWIKKNSMVKEKDVKISLHQVFNIIKELIHI